MNLVRNDAFFFYFTDFFIGFSEASLLVTLDQKEMGYYKGAPHVDTPMRGVRTNLLFLTAGNEVTSFLEGPLFLHNNAEAESMYPGGIPFLPGPETLSADWAKYLRKRFVFFLFLFLIFHSHSVQIWIYAPAP